MRNAFAAELAAIAEVDPRVVLLSGDIGNRLFDDFKARHPGRFFNCGVAEGNMMSVAAGMALSGLRPVTYTITPFTTARCYEQIKIDVGYHRAPVTIVGTGAGFSYAELGATHHSFEDIAILSAIPDMAVVCPGDPVEVRLALRAALAWDGPVYVRLGKKGEPTIHATTPDFRIGRGLPIRTGTDVALLSTGNMLGPSVDTAGQLKKLGLSAAVVSLPTVKPLDQPLLLELFQRFSLVVTVEEHSLVGGLGSQVASWLVDLRQPLPARLLRLGVPDAFYHQVGDQQAARTAFGLEPEAMARRILEAWATVQGKGP